MTAILELRAVKAFYGQSEVLHGIDLAVEEAGMTVILGANGAGKTTALRAICGMVRSEGEIVFNGYFPILAQRRAQQAGALSGGEQQMLAIARALMMSPRLLVLDEPSFGLAPRVVEAIFGIVERIRREQRVSVLLVEQNASLALEMADRAYLLETGYVVTSGSAKTLADDPQIRRSYLGY
jgi:branched-chain amino acid transport system ATP-binding protein